MQGSREDDRAGVNPERALQSGKDGHACLAESILFKARGKERNTQVSHFMVSVARARARLHATQTRRVSYNQISSVRIYTRVHERTFLLSVSLGCFYCARECVVFVRLHFFPRAPGLQL